MSLPSPNPSLSPLPSSTSSSTTSTPSSSPPMENSSLGVPIIPVEGTSSLSGRMLDVEHEDLENFSPVTGVSTAESLSFEECVRRTDIASMRIHIRAARLFAQSLDETRLGSLSMDEAAAIHLYTQESSFYKVMNGLLRQRSRDALKKFLPYLKVFVSAARKLPRHSDTLFRGIKGDVSSKFAQKKGKTIVWWGCSSCSTDINVMERAEFCGKSGERTIFNILAKHAVDISPFSAVANESEWILLPGAQLQVKGVADVGGGLKLIHLQEMDLPFILDEFEGEEEEQQLKKDALSVVKPSVPISASPAPILPSTSTSSALSKLPTPVQQKLVTIPLKAKSKTQENEHLEEEKSTLTTPNSPSASAVHVSADPVPSKVLKSQFQTDLFIPNYTMTKKSAAPVFSDIQGDFPKSKAIIEDYVDMVNNLSSSSTSNSSVSSNRPTSSTGSKPTSSISSNMPVMNMQKTAAPERLLPALKSDAKKKMPLRTAKK